MTWKPPDFSKPSVARVHDALPGGHGNFAADRELAGRLLEICPDLGSAARENKTFIARAAELGSPAGRPPVRRPRLRPARVPLRRGRGPRSRPVGAARLRRPRSGRHRARAGAAGDRRR